MIYNAEAIEGLEQRFRANLINSLSGFKSANLVGSINEAGLSNLAIFTQVFHIGANPALVGLLVRPDSVPRHTLTNIMETGFFTLNHIPIPYYQQAHQTSARYEVSEFEACGFKAEFSALHPAPYVAEARIKTGLRLEERHNLLINGTVLLIGRVIELICPDECLGLDGYLDIEQAGSVTVSGLDSYHSTTRLGDRLPYAKP